MVKYSTAQPVVSSLTFQQLTQWTVATDQMSIMGDLHEKTDQSFQSVFYVPRGITQSNKKWLKEERWLKQKDGGN